MTFLHRKNNKKAYLHQVLTPYPLPISQLHGLRENLWTQMFETIEQLGTCITHFFAGPF